MAEKIETVSGYSGGREDQLHNAAGLWLAIAILAGVGMVFFAFNAFDRYDGEWIGIFWLGAAAVTICQAALVYFFCVAIADILRVQKQQAGLSFGGEIKEPTVVVSYTCSACGSITHMASIHCQECNEKFTEDDPS